MPITKFIKPLLLIVTLFVITLLSLPAIGQNYIEVDKLTALDRSNDDRMGTFAVAIEGNIAFVGAKLEDDDANGNNPMNEAGSVYIYQRDNTGNWSQIQKIVASDRAVNDQFGISVSISGNYAVIGTRYGGGNSLNTNFQPHTGSAYIFKRQSNGNWIEFQKLISINGMTHDEFGTSVSISGNRIIIGARGQDFDLNHANQISYAGAVYVFEQNSTGIWVQKQKLVSPNRVSYGYYGGAVSISGNHAVIGNNYHSSNQNLVYLAERNSNGAWVNVQQLSTNTLQVYDHYGASVSISEDYLIIGAHLTDYSNGIPTLSFAGAAYIFKKDNQGNWAETQKIVASDASKYSYFGISVSISNDRIIVGSYGESFNTIGGDSLRTAGAAYIFHLHANGQWIENQKIVASDRATYNEFGYSVAISNEHAIVGAINAQDTVGGNTFFRAGAAYVFETPPCLTSDSSFAVIECDSFTVPSSKITYSTPGNYIVLDTVPNHCGGDSILNIDITILPLKASNINPTICYGDTVIVNGTSYHSANPSGTEIISNVGPFNCDSTITVSLNVLPQKESTITEVLCNNDSIIVNGVTYNSSNLSGTEVFHNIGPNNCDSIVIIDLQAYTPLIVQTDPIGEVCMDEKIQITATLNEGKPPYTFLWTYDGITATDEYFSFIPHINSDQYVYLIVQDNCNKSENLTLPITVQNCEIIIPNIITPNGDGVNDYFQIIGLNFYTTKSLSLYNRWGVLIFEDSNYLNNWDAYSIPDGVYFYILEVMRTGELKIYNGPLTILR